MVDPGTATLAVGGFSALTNMIGGKEAKRQGDKALEMQAEQAAWVRSLFNERKGDIARVQCVGQDGGKRRQRHQGWRDQIKPAARLVQALP